MKKIFVLILTIALVSALFCISAFAANDPASGTVLRVSAEKKDGSTTLINDYTSFEDGWNAAMELASNFRELNNKGYTRVIVELCADWNAVNGEFTGDFFNGKGFNWDAIYFPSKVKVTLNMGGYTINRGLTEYELNGEVMYIDEDADVIIENGTITGGWSYNGAGGIHINDGASVALNNVNVVGNTVTTDQGAAIALYDGATLIMTGGKLADNILDYPAHYYEDTKGTLYVDNSTAVLTDVVFSGNRQTGALTVKGSAVALCGTSTVTLNDCLVENQGRNDEKCATSLFYGDAQSELILNNTVIKNNGTWYSGEAGYSTAIDMDGKLTMSECMVTDNAFFAIFQIALKGCTYDIMDCVITDNQSEIFTYEPSGSNNTVTLTNCQFDNNFAQKYKKATFEVVVCRTGLAADITFVDCEFGNSTFDNERNYTFVNTADNAAGTMLTEGSISMIISLVSLLASVALLVVTIVSSKKRTAINAQEHEEEA